MNKNLVENSCLSLYGLLVSSKATTTVRSFVESCGVSESTVSKESKLFFFHLGASSFSSP